MGGRAGGRAHGQAGMRAGRRYPAARTSGCTGGLHYSLLQEDFHPCACQVTVHGVTVDTVEMEEILTVFS